LNRLAFFPKTPSIRQIFENKPPKKIQKTKMDVIGTMKEQQQQQQP
jgi:hypothetical protein